MNTADHAATAASAGDEARPVSAMTAAGGGRDQFGMAQPCTFAAAPAGKAGNPPPKEHRLQLKDAIAFLHSVRRPATPAEIEEKCRVTILGNPVTVRCGAARCGALRRPL